MTADLFGSIDPAPETPHILTVSELTRAVRSALESEVGTIWVEGEISNYRKQPSGHQYFTLKDAQSQVPCVWFARGGLRMKQLALADGMQVQVRGALTVYEARGQYQVNVQLVQAGGAGLLQAKFEALKRKLSAEGLFDEERKRALPRFPAVIGLVTSPTGAAISDILNILARRAPWVRVIVHPVRVQGEGAAAEIAAAIEQLNRMTVTGFAPVEVILVGRGGGSTEDLWEFNEEVVARAIVGSAIPIVSAVGHEIDFTIADFAADLRAPTPSAAAELLVPDGAELARFFTDRHNQLRRAVSGVISRERARLSYLARSTVFQAPLRRVRELAQRTDAVRENIQRQLQESLQAPRQRLANLDGQIRRSRPDQRLAICRSELTARLDSLRKLVKSQWQERQQRLARVEILFRAISPDATLARGYSITTDEAGKIVRSVEEVKPEMKLTTRLRDGSIRSEVS